MYAVGMLCDKCPQWGMGEEGGSLECKSWGCSGRCVLNGGWGRRGGSQPYTPWGMLTDKCPKWGMGENRISAIYAVGDAQWDKLNFFACSASQALIIGVGCLFVINIIISYQYILILIRGTTKISLSLSGG